MKICSKCKKEKPKTKFHKRYSTKGGHQTGLTSQCKECRKIYRDLKHQKEYRRKFKNERYKETGQTKAMKKSLDKYRSSNKFRNTRLKRKYNITLEDYDKMFEQQEGVCAICGLPEVNKRLAVDHNHKTGEVRGLLCQRCNRALGLLEDKEDILENAINYLLQHKRSN